MNTVSILLGAALMGQTVPKESTHPLPLHELAAAGIDPEVVIDSFYEQSGKVININELIRVSYDAEGNEFNFESLDHLSVVVPLMQARAADAKGGDGVGL